MQLWVRYVWAAIQSLVPQVRNSMRCSRLRHTPALNARRSRRDQEENITTARVAVLICIAVLCGVTRADQIELKNGDRLTGTIVKSDQKELVVSTDYAGRLTIDWAAVKSLSSTTPLDVQMKDGRVLRGSVAGDGT
jgi:small nuclear ribonucleoprotein (snRNP)-like protein